jgi:hypothetical protein
MPHHQKYIFLIWFIIVYQSLDAVQQESQAAKAAKAARCVF